MVQFQSLVIKTISRQPHMQMVKQGQIHMQWLSKSASAPYTQVFLQEGHGQWKTEERQSQQCC